MNKINTKKNKKTDPQSDSKTKFKNLRRFKGTPDVLMEEVEKMLREIKKMDLAEIEAFLAINGIPLIFANTIVLLQGKQGSNKSRLAATIAAAIIRHPEFKQSPLGLKVSMQDLYLLYIDTERNLSQQFPKAIQDIQSAAGYPKDEDPPNFGYSSLLEVDRSQRFDALKKFVEKKRDQLGESTHIVIILDVVSDLIKNFNDPVDSLALNDYLNDLINTENCTIIAVLHENSSTANEKARGHLGSELSNKASTIIQVANDEDETVKITVKKSRNTKLPKPVYAKYDDHTGGLVLIDACEIPQAQPNPGKADLISVAVFLGEHLQTPMLRSEIIKEMVDHFDCSERTIESRIKEIVESYLLIPTPNGDLELVKEHKQDGLYYKLEEPKKATAIDDCEGDELPVAV